MNNGNKLSILMQNISLSYKLFQQPKDRLKEVFHPFGKKYHRQFHALKNVSLSVKTGEILGILGKNGAGKSTLLKVVSGILPPSTGRLEVNGSIAALFEIGGGFNPEFTGLQNINFYCTMNKVQKAVLKKMLDDIIDFADIGEFIHQPFKTYSNGMKARLAFSAAIHVDPDILIIDEVLSVGDMRFRQKCLRKLRGFMESGKTIIIVSHDIGTINNFCTRAIWLHDGDIKEDGLPKQVGNHYYSFMTHGMSSGAHPENRQNDTKAGHVSSGFQWQDLSGCDSFGEGGAVIRGVALIEKRSNRPIQVITGGRDVVLLLKVEVYKIIECPLFGFVLRNRAGLSITGSNTSVSGCYVPGLQPGHQYVVRMKFRLPRIANGQYALTVSVAEGTNEDHVQHHWVNEAMVVKVDIPKPLYRMKWFVNLDYFQVELEGHVTKGKIHE